MPDRIRDRLLERASEQFTEWTGLTFADASDVTRMREDIDQWETFAADAEDLAFWVLQGDGGGSNGPGREKDLNRETSIRLAKASRRAWSRDPIAGTEAEHYANFSLGRGVNRPVCPDQDVQMVVDRAWKDANNQQVLLSLDALRGLSHELIASSNVFLVAYRGNGMVRIGVLPSDVVKQVVTYPGNPLLPLYYVGQKTEAKWDFSSNSWKVDLSSGTKVRYWKQWRNVDELEGDPALDDYAPSDDQLEEGGVYHVRTNRLLEQMFGVPRWNRTLRFMVSLNRLVEARVAMAQASASIIAKRVMRGGKSDVMKAAQTVLQQAGEIGAARVPIPTAAGPAATPRPGMRPGSFHVENEGDQLQAFTLNSGSAQAQQDMQIIRGQAVSPSALGQHLYGDQDAAQLGTAATLELPAQMALGAWQEMIEQILRWFTDIVIEEAVRNGELGGNLPDEEDEGSPLKEEDSRFSMIPRKVRGKRLSELVLTEAMDQAEAERRTGKDLSYTFEMPYPGRRNLPDIVSTFTEVMGVLSPGGENPVLTKVMLSFLLTHGLQLENASDLAEEIAKAQATLVQQQMDQQQAAIDAQNAAASANGFSNAATPTDPGGAVGTSDASPDSRNRNRPDTARPVYGEKRAVSGVAQEGALDLLPDDVVAQVQKILAGISETYASALADPAAEAAERLNGSTARAA